ncbi:hypothetical protein Pst134EA_017167 [Puccinia striiformis f. sp. tritici]|uniref:hypothetical protein n=1 Tax=Puccinia striiformis f. sp. tritici TaxID=168172 RepID=UPI002008A49D|nr:hypothetical protein Pst134EA_017167 [Puccinia striiformis f. sp. tritici]KAH9460852.1 hypothetical protein Pst134EA_017167 [Puccinia striiformis f. sp. tritici]
MSTTLLSLPIEILQDIHLLSTSEHLPISCKRLYEIYTRTTTARYRAEYLWRKYALKDQQWTEDEEQRRNDDNSIGRTTERRRKIRWDAILACPACSIEVLSILRHFHSERLHSSDQRTVPKLKLPGLPTRLFKALSSEPSTGSNSKDLLNQLDQAYRYIQLLLTDYGASPDKLGGYPLARSVLSGNVPFIRLLLNHGARPGIKDDLVIMVAIETGDLSLLRLLIEPGFIHPLESSLPSKDTVNPVNPLLLHQNSSPKIIQSNKKIKLDDRVQITDQMLEKAIRRKDPKMAQYFIEKGARPTLETIRLLESL